MIMVAFKSWGQNHCSKKCKGVVLLFEDLSGGIDKKGCLVTACSCAGKRWIGEGTEWPGPALWAFFPPWVLTVIGHCCFHQCNIP